MADTRQPKNEADNYISKEIEGRLSQYIEVCGTKPGTVCREPSMKLTWFRTLSLAVQYETPGRVPESKSAVEVGIR